MRAEFSKNTKLAAYQRANGVCEAEGCTALLMPGKFHYDHINPSEFSGDASLENCQCLCLAHHAEKTGKRDIPAISKSNRLRLRAAGIRRERKILAWRNFSGTIIRKGRSRDE